MYLTNRESNLLGELINQLGQNCSEQEIRLYMGQQLLRLLKADFYASFAWNDAARRFTDMVAINMDAGNLAAYEEYFQYRDPITPQLQGRRVPTLVAQIMPQKELMKTEFFNDFLARDKLFHGVNLYAYDGHSNIGDMRIWRSKKRDNFDRTALLILSMIQPAFTSALKRARSRSAQMATSATDVTTEPIRGLSERETVIARCVSNGLCDKRIAQQLGIAFSTVRTHLSRIFTKLGVHSRTQLIQYLLNHRLL